MAQGQTSCGCPKSCKLSAAGSRFNLLIRPFEVVRPELVEALRQAQCERLKVHGADRRFRSNGCGHEPAPASPLPGTSITARAGTSDGHVQVQSPCSTASGAGRMPACCRTSKPGRDVCAENTTNCRATRTAPGVAIEFRHGAVLASPGISKIRLGLATFLSMES